MKKFPKVITRFLFLGLVSIPVSGFAESKSNLPLNPDLVSGTANFNINGSTLTIEQNTDKLITDIGKQLEKSKAEVFLFGIGIAKMNLAYKFKNYFYRWESKKRKDH